MRSVPMASDFELANHISSCMSVAHKAAREKGQPYAFDLMPGWWSSSNAPESQPPIFGMERVAVVDPWCELTREELMGVCKRIFTARMMGRTGSAGVEAAFGVNTSSAGKKFESDQALWEHLTAPKTGPSGMPDDEPGFTAEELIPIPAVCKPCGLEFAGDDAILAPDLRGEGCPKCGVPLRPHPKFPVVSAYERRRLAALGVRLGPFPQTALKPSGIPQESARFDPTPIPTKPAGKMTQVSMFGDDD